MARDEDLYSSQPAYDLFLSQASGSGVKWQQEKSRLRDELLSEAEIGSTAEPPIIPSLIDPAPIPLSDTRRAVPERRISIGPPSSQSESGPDVVLWKQMLCEVSRTTNQNAKIKSKQIDKAESLHGSFRRTPGAHEGAGDAPKISLRREQTSDAIPTEPNRSGSKAASRSSSSGSVPIATGLSANGSLTKSETETSRKHKNLSFKPIETDYDFPSSTPSPSSNDHARRPWEAPQVIGCYSASSSTRTASDFVSSSSSEVLEPMEVDEDSDGDSDSPCVQQSDTTSSTKGKGRAEDSRPVDNHHTVRAAPQPLHPSRKRSASTSSNASDCPLSRPFVPPTQERAAQTSRLVARKPPPSLGMRPRARQGHGYQSKSFKAPFKRPRLTAAAGSPSLQSPPDVPSASNVEAEAGSPTPAERTASPEVPDDPVVIARMQEASFLERAGLKGPVKMTARGAEPVGENDAQVGNSSDSLWEHFD